MAYTCPFCGAVSHNPNDERERYCGRCYRFAEAAYIQPEGSVREVRRMGTVPGHEIQRPTVGRRVRYVAEHDLPEFGIRRGDTYAADITRLQLTGDPADMAVDLVVLAPREGDVRVLAVKHDPTEQAPRSWHWPPRE